MEEFRNEVIRHVRSCLISTKNQISLRQLEDDYRILLGEKIPYAKLGYKTLESFLASEPSLIMTRTPNGQIFVDAEDNVVSAHMSSMVRKQKPPTTKKKNVRIAPRFNRTHHIQPPPATTRWRPQKKNGFGGSGGGGFSPSTSGRSPRPERSSRLAAVSHNQFVSGGGGGGGYRRPQVPSKVVVVNHQQQNHHHQQQRQQPETERPTAAVNNRELRRMNSSPEKLESNGVGGGEEMLGGGGGGDGKECSPLTSTKKRLNRLMSEISLERDSGNSSPTTEYAATYKPYVQEFTKTGDLRYDLRNFAAYHKLGEVEVNFAETKSKKSKVVEYYCKIKVGQHMYSSYPKDFFNKETAELYASEKALDDLIKKYSRRKSLLISSNDDIIDRVPPMLEKHTGAVWMWQIEADYIDKYNEQLASDWLQVIDSSQYVSIEKCTGGYVLRHCNPDDVLQKGKKHDVNLNLGDVSVPCNTVQFNDNNRLYAVVTAALSSNEVWCQHCNTSEYNKFVEMIENMETFYNNNKADLVAKNINFGCCYVILHDGNWSRVRAVSVPQDGYVDCFLIDYGEELRVQVDNVYMLKREFAVEQAQAFVCRLDGLEDLYEASIDSDHLSNLVSRVFILEMVVDETSENTDLTIPVVMYDITTGTSVNQELISLLTIESAMPVLDKNAITEVYVSNIEPNGDVYVQVRTPGYWSLMDMLGRIEKDIAKDPSTELIEPVTKDNSAGRLYLVKNKLTDRWQRATVLDWAPKGDMAQIYYVDFGNTEVIYVAHEVMYPLDKLDDVVSQYPSQAIKVRIMIEKIPIDFVERASKLMPQDQTILLKITNYDNEKVAWVEFFKRSTDGGLFCINKSISVEAELKNIDVSNNNDKNTRKRLINLVQFDGTKNVPSGGSLRKPDLPEKGDYFNVNVPFAVNPWNFFVQPLDTLNELTALMQDMQERYSQVQYSPLQIEDIVPGKIYASKHEDGLWYRTSVLKVIHSGSISVYYCDFGYYTSLTLAQLIPLDEKYMNFPYQALKAKISGIKPPIQNKWTMDDCDFFNSLVTKKQFVSILVNIEKDELYKSDIILQLILIDTSTEQDINIKDVLVEKGIATTV